MWDSISVIPCCTSDATTPIVASICLYPATEEKSLSQYIDGLLYDPCCMMVIRSKKVQVRLSVATTIWLPFFFSRFCILVVYLSAFHNFHFTHATRTCHSCNLVRTNASWMHVLKKQHGHHDTGAISLCLGSEGFHWSVSYDVIMFTETHWTRSYHTVSGFTTINRWTVKCPSHKSWAFRCWCIVVL